LAQGALAPGRVMALTDRPEAQGVVQGPAGPVPVRVAGGVPGDRGVFRVTHVGKNASWAAVHDLTRPSPVRVEAPCPVTHRCGGCPWQAVDLVAQRAARLALAQRATKGVIPRAAWRPWPHPPEPVGYRTRALVALRHVGGRLRYGFFEPRSNRLVPAEPCAVHHPRVEAALRAARDILEARGLGTWRGPDRPGLLRGLLFRLDPDTPRADPAAGGLMTFVVSRPDEALRAAARELVGQAGVSGVFAHIQDAPGGPLVGRGPTHHLAGAETQRLHYETVGGTLALDVGPVTFVQTHHAAARALVASLGALAPPPSAGLGHLVDLYAGAGLMGLSLRARARHLTLVEASPAACEDARRNVARLGLAGQARVIQGDAAAHAPELLTALGPEDLVLLDPPRAGCGPEVVRALAASGLRRALYVSCQPRALGRDLRALAPAGWRVDAAVPVDMFPHTPHLEVVVSLVREGEVASARERIEIHGE